MTTETTTTIEAAPAADSLLTPAAPISTDTQSVATPAKTDTDTVATTPVEGDWLPEKFRVMDAEGKLDEAASARKLSESYQALEKHKGPLSQAPATADEYKIDAPKDAEGNALDIPGLDMEQFTGDPMFKTLAADAHKLGVTNDQLQFFVNKYLTVVPELFAAKAQLDLQEARAELKAIWKDDQAIDRGTVDAVRAINGFGAEADDVPGSRSRIMAKYGRDPDFIAFAASVAAEMKEDRMPVANPAMSDGDIEALQKSPAYWDKNHPDHTNTKAKVDTFYAKKFGNQARGRRSA